MADNKKQYEEFAKMLEKFSRNADSSKKSVKELGEAISDATDSMREINKELNKNTSHFKEFAKLTDSYGKLDSELNTLSKDLDKLGVIASDGFFELEKAADDAKKKLSEIGQVTERLTKNQLGFAKIPASISKIKKSFESAFKGGNKNLDSFRKEMEQLSFKKLSDNFKEDNQNAFKEVAKSLLEDLDFDNMLDFGGLDEQSKLIVENLKRIKETGGNSVEDVLNGIEDLEATQELFNKTIEKSQSNMKVLADQAKNDFKKVEESIKSFQKRFDMSKVVQNNMQDVAATMSDMISGVNQKANDLKILPSDLGSEFNEAKELSEGLADNLERLNKLSERLASKDLSQEEKENIIKLQEEELKQLYKAEAAIKDKLENTNLYLDAVEKTAVMNWGIDRLNKVKVGIFQVSAMFEGMAKQGDNAFTKAFNSLHSKFKSLGNYMSKFKFAAGMIGGAYSLIKATAEIEAQAGKTFRSVADAGIGVGEGAETIASTIKDAAHETINLGGLIDANITGDSFALSQEEILGVVGGLNQAGMSAAKLKDQMGPVMNSFSETKSEMVAAASMVRVFSSNLGIADAEITSMMGNMSHEFNASMGSMQEGLTAITNAQQKSGISGVKFMGILSTTTAGLAIYEDQISSTAEAISKLAQNTSLSGKSIENFARSALEASQDTNTMMQNLSLMGKEGMDSIKVTLEADLKRLEEKRSKTTDKKELEQLDGYIHYTKESIKAINNADIPNLAASMDRIDPEAQIKAQAATTLKMLESVPENSPLAQKAIMEATKLDKAFESLKSLTPEAQKKALKDIMEGKDRGGDKTAKELKEAALAKDELTGDPLKKLGEAIENKTNVYLSNMVGLLKVISAMMAASGGASAVLNVGKDLFGKAKGLFGKGGGGPSGPGNFGNSTFTKYGGGGGSKLSPSWRGPLGGGGGGAGAAMPSAAKASSGAGLFSKLGDKFKGGALSKLTGGLKGLGAFKGLAKFAVGANPIGKALTMGAGLVSGIMNAGDIAGKDASQLTLGDKAQAGISNALSEASFGLIDPKTIFKGIDAINPFSGTPSAPSGVTVPGSAVNRATGLASSTDPKAVKTPGSGGTVVNIHVNGNDENRLRKVIMSTIKDYEDMKGKG